jgi:hypothetical protein
MTELNVALGLICTIFLAWIAYKAQQNTKAVNEIHLAVNSRLDKLIEEMSKNVLATGIAKGRAQVEEEQDKTK